MHKTSPTQSPLPPFCSFKNDNLISRKAGLVAQGKSLLQQKHAADLAIAAAVLAGNEALANLTHAATQLRAEIAEGRPLITAAKSQTATARLAVDQNKQLLEVERKKAQDAADALIPVRHSLRCSIAEVSSQGGTRWWRAPPWG